MARMMRSNSTNFVLIALEFWIAILSATNFAHGDHDASHPTEEIDFARDVKPIFEAHCYSCHGVEKQESNFRLDVKKLALGTGDFGEPPILPGQGSMSPLIRFVSGDDPDLIMPPEGAGTKLDKNQVEVLRKWIEDGAVWPDELAGDPEIRLTTDHWSFQPVSDHDLPAIDSPVTNYFPLQNGIDHFIAARLSQVGIDPSNPADRLTLIRRLYLDMHGLPPSPIDVEAFVRNESDDAWSKLIDQVLDSPHYGERWARHWLDVVRFGESTGYEVNRDRANAWYYRDYVIDSFNSDKSFQDFVVEQIAGDAVGVDAATGFLVGGPNDIVKSPDINLTLMQRQDELADYVNTTCTTFLGLTVACARCHNHKFDPILQRDYYALQAVFAGVQHGERKLNSRVSSQLRQSLTNTSNRLHDKEAQFAKLRNSAPKSNLPGKDLAPAVNAKLNTDSFAKVEAKFVRFSIRRTNTYEPCLDELEVYSFDGNQNVALTSRGGKASSSGNYVGNPKHQLKHINDGQFGNDFSWISDTVGKGLIQIEFPETLTVNRVVWGRDRQGIYADRLPIDYSISVSVDGETWTEVSNSARRKPFLVNGKEAEDAFISRLPPDEAAVAIKTYDEVLDIREQIKKLEQTIPVGYVGTFKNAEPIFRLHRGDPMSPRESVDPDTLLVMGTLGLDPRSKEQERRLTLARWIASSENPLTARVIVNRIWHYHFGQGLVSTPSDFGKNGARPTHPELLDYLASKFMDNGWSLKWLHREILSSSTYRQSSRPRANALAKDAECNLLWRFPPRRLEAEAIRDCVLNVSGKLNPQKGGPGFLLFKIDRENVHHYFPLDKFEPEHFRRMIYMTKIRQEQDDVFGAFDCPDGGQTIPKRNRSTTALQALNLLNSQFMIEQSEHLADRLRTAANNNTREQIKLAYRLAFSRLPTDEELSDALQFVDQHELEAFCRAILNANEFLFVS